jgi:tripartite ATP-independent transporter DctM subunit
LASAFLLFFFGLVMESNYLVILAVLLGSLAATVPVFMALFFTGLVGLVWMVGIDPQIVVEVLYRSMDKFALIVVLFFVLCGNIMTTGSIVQKLIKTANVLVGFLPGGLAMAGVLACGFFGAISGSTVATVVAIGGFMIPALIENGYDEKFSVGIMTTAPILGIIIPPSISMILYAMVTNDSLEALFLTGFIPGILIIVFMSFYAFFFCKRQGLNTAPRPTLREAGAVIRESIWALLLPVLIFGGIYSGLFTANEAAVVACFYAFFVEICIHRDMKLRDVKKVTVASAVTSATLLVIVAGASVFGEYLTFEQIPNKIANAVVANIQTPWVFLLAVNILLLIIGMFMDIISATLILTPIFLPLLSRFGIDTMHFGLLMTINLGIGYCTPPLGVSLYISGAVVDRDLLYVTRAVMPFLLIQVALLLVLTYWPGLVMLLPHLVYGH